MAIFSLIVSSIMAGIVAVTLFASRSYKGGLSVSLACLAAGVLLCPALGAIFPPVALTALVLAILCGAFARRTPPTPRRIALVSLTAVSLGMVGGVLFSLDYAWRLRALREEYPLVSIAPRLEYEMKPAARAASLSAPPADPNVRFGPPPPTAPAWALLSANEGRHHWRGRTRALETIHGSLVEQFISAPGFGIARMAYVSENDVKIHREPPAKLRGTADKYPPPDRPDALHGSHLNTTRFDSQEGEFEGRLWDVHEGGQFDFFDSQDEGLVIDRDHVAGFVPHRFSSSFPPWPDRPPVKWELRRLELVSLRRFGRPMVYATNQNLPQMDQLDHVPTREPTTFESAALDSLARGEELVYVESGQSIFALGALRARENCTKCHEVQLGALLGAFSYEFLDNAVSEGGSPRGKPPI